MLPQPRKDKADCECCPKTDVVVYMMHGNMLMCQECCNKEVEATERNNSVNSMIESSRQIDMSIELKTDVHLARTVALAELKAAIDNDSTIPADQKDYAFTKECFVRFQHLQKVIFDTRKELNEKENELRMWQVNVQTSAAKLRVEYREQFKALDVTYAPVVKTSKPKTVKPGKVKFSLAQIKEAAAKYKIPVAMVPAIQMMILQRNMTAEDAAKDLAQKMGQIK